MPPGAVAERLRALKPPQLSCWEPFISQFLRTCDSHTKYYLYWFFFDAVSCRTTVMFRGVFGDKGQHYKQAWKPPPSFPFPKATMLKAGSPREGARTLLQVDCRWIRKRQRQSLSPENSGFKTFTLMFLQTPISEELCPGLSTSLPAPPTI